MIFMVKGGHIARRAFIASGMFLLMSFLLTLCFAQEDAETINQGKFVELIFQAKQLDLISETNLVLNQASVEDFGTQRTYSDTINTSTLLGKKRFLEHLGYCPEGGYNLDKILTYGDFAVTLVKVLHLSAPDNPTPDDYIDLLVDKGIIDKKDAETPMTLQEVLDALEKANIPAVDVKMQDYQKPLSPIE
ncbi:hypothetical protein JXQ70_04780 [bacterium]|nr:hypothetical protein [bacterium]